MGLTMVVMVDHRLLRTSQKRNDLYVLIVLGLLHEADIYNDMNGPVLSLFFSLILFGKRF
jgi:hypothetical protein